MIKEANLPLILMSSFMILLVSYACKNPRAIFALIRLLSGMRAHMDHEVSFLRESPLALFSRTLEQL